MMVGSASRALVSLPDGWWWWWNSPTSTPVLRPTPLPTYTHSPTTPPTSYPTYLPSTSPSTFFPTVTPSAVPTASPALFVYNVVIIHYVEAISAVLLVVSIFICCYQYRRRRAVTEPLRYLELPPSSTHKLETGSGVNSEVHKTPRRSAPYNTAVSNASQRDRIRSPDMNPAARLTLNTDANRLAVDEAIRSHPYFNSCEPTAFSYEMPLLLSELFRRRTLINTFSGSSLELLIRNNDSFVVRANEVKVKYLTPFQGREGYRMFGHYKCCDRWKGGSHSRKWKSAYSYKNTWQQCKSCSKKCYPYRQDILRGEGSDPGKPHETELCGRCQSLGRPCTGR
jgi:hypothetical protein